MSTAFYSQGMESYGNTAPGASPYKTWKGTGKYSNPVAITSGYIRPLTNNDPTNNAPQKFGLPRPLKWNYRVGNITQPYITVVNPNKPNQYVQVSRLVRPSSTYALIGQVMEQPGRYIVKQNPNDEINNVIQTEEDCKTCQGISFIDKYYPSRNLTSNPQPITTSAEFCCNDQQKALVNVQGASTLLSKNYYTSTAQYLQARCQSYYQKTFNFYSGPIVPAYYAEIVAKNPKLAAQILAAKPGSPLSYDNTYIANCYPDTTPSLTSQQVVVNQLFQLIKQANAFTNADITNYNAQYQNITTLADLNKFLQTISGNVALANTMFNAFIQNPNYVGVLTGSNSQNGCQKVIYKPSNPQFAVQGSVPSSTRTFKLTTDTISTNLNSIRRLQGSDAVYNSIGQPFVPFVYKEKVAPCSPTQFPNNQSPTVCFNSKQKASMGSYNPTALMGGMIQGTQVSEVGIGDV